MSMENDRRDLTRVGPGTVMGEFMRQYWIPCMMSSELEADGNPVRLPLMGEKLIAFRDSSGRVGILDQRCPHRCASLFLGRNEEHGMRCVYHGWKFDVDGNCVDMPSVPEGDTLKHKIKAKAYRVRERAGLVWVYMGSRETPPPLPDIEPNLLDADDCDIALMYRECNWLQSLEGDIDTSHFGFLHAGAVDTNTLDPTHPVYGTVVDRAPQYEVAETPWGTGYGAYRLLPDGSMYWRTANFLFPFWSQTPAGPFSDAVQARAWVPIDDHRTMLFSLSWKDGFFGTRRRAANPLAFKSGNIKLAPLTNNYLPNTTDWYGRWRLAENERNDWMIDREKQRSGITFSGICNVHMEDQAVTESMGLITDHAWEHLTTADLMIARTRRRLLRAARAFSHSGTVPPGVDEPEIFLGARSGFFTAEPGRKWQDLYEERLKTVERPASELEIIR